MKSICLLFFMLSFYAKSQNLEDYRWKNRVVLLFSEQENDLKKQETLFHAEREALAERDMVILIGTEKLQKKLGLPKKIQGVVLIGKDGGFKFSKAFFVKPETLFTLIDSMPMRKAEMKQQKKKSGQ